MADVTQNTLYLTTQGCYVSRDHLTLQVEVPVYPPDLEPSRHKRENSIEQKKLSIPIHHLESICVFGQSNMSPHAVDLCCKNGVAINYLSESGYFRARFVGIPDTSVSLRRAQFRSADNGKRSAAIARDIVAGKIQNMRNSLLRAGRENQAPSEQETIENVTDRLARQIRILGESQKTGPASNEVLDSIRGAEGLATREYFSVFTYTLKQQREYFSFSSRTRRPPRDRINCLLSFLYALLRHDCITALASVGLDPFVGFLHTERPNRPSLALDLMEEFRPWIADRLAITLINRQQISKEHIVEREGGAFEFTETGRKSVITAYQQRKLDSMTHPLLEKSFRIGQMPHIQARILARHLREDLPHYIPLIPK